MSNHLVATQKPRAITRWLRLLIGFLSITFALAALLLISCYLTILYAHHKAQNLLAEVPILEPGKTPISDVQKLVERYGGERYDAHSYFGYVGSDATYASPDPCLDDAMSYAVFANPASIVSKATQALPVLQRIGLHPWYVSLAIHHKGGVVTCYSQNVLFVRADGQWVEGSANLNLKNPDSLVEHQAYEAMSFVSRNQYHHTRVDVLGEASAEQKRRAFQMDLSCMVSLRGCYFSCQIVPLGWLDSVRDRESHGGELPEGTNDPRCPSR